MSGYYIDLVDIINNLNEEEILVLDYLRDTDRFNGITITDMEQSQLGIRKTKLYVILDKFKTLNAIGFVISSRYHSYYIKDNGKLILQYLQEN